MSKRPNGFFVDSSKLQNACSAFGNKRQLRYCESIISKLISNIHEYILPSWPWAVVPAANAQSRAAMMVDGVNWFILSTDISGLN